ncbi:hypothetical protein Peur_051293 [Populus x canadensis]
MKNEQNRFVTGNKWCVHAKQEGPTPGFGFSGTRDDLATIIALYSSINLILVVAKLILSSRLLGSSNGASVIKKSENGDFPAKIEPCQSCVYRSADIKSIRICAKMSIADGLLYANLVAMTTELIHRQ